MKCCAGGQCTLYRRRQATRLVAHLCWTHFTSSFHVISTLHQMCILQNVDYYYPITSNTQPLQHPAADAPVTQDTQKAASQGHLRIHRSVVLQQSTLCGHNRRYEHFPDGFKQLSTYWCTPLWQFQLPAVHSSSFLRSHSPHPTPASATHEMSQLHKLSLLLRWHHFSLLKLGWKQVHLR